MQEKKVWKISEVLSLYDDELTLTKLTVMTKFDALMDDERNPALTPEKEEELEDFLQVGKIYRITTTLEELE